MAAAGITHELIARVIWPGGIGQETLRRHFNEELDCALAEANTKVAQSLFNQAISGNVTAQIFWLKTRARWRETSAVIEGGERQPVSFNINFVEAIPEHTSSTGIKEINPHQFSGENVAVLAPRKI